VDRQVNDALIECRNLAARLTPGVPPLHSQIGQEGPVVPVAAAAEVQPMLSMDIKAPKARKGKRQNKSQGLKDPDYLSSESEADSDDSSLPEGTFPVRGRASPGLKELIPSRSDYRLLVSYRSYRLENTSQRYDGTISRRLAPLIMGIRHSVEDKFTGADPIEILDFLRSFKESADHLDVSEGAATRLFPYFLDGLARERYRTHLTRAPVESANASLSGCDSVQSPRGRDGTSLWGPAL
jgi:hypothetical protein